MVNEYESCGLMVTQIILEDDPYYYLQFSEQRIPSYLSFDVDGWAPQ